MIESVLEILGAIAIVIVGGYLLISMGNGCANLIFEFVKGGGRKRIDELEKENLMLRHGITASIDIISEFPTSQLSERQKIAFHNLVEIENRNMKELPEKDSVPWPPAGRVPQKPGPLGL